ncbi:hypothetical protein CON64_18570 [Bacillus pseudomycoides]|nr:hypothetical protein CON64_18570 [Bacillus pseudomycoides]
MKMRTTMVGEGILKAAEVAANMGAEINDSQLVVNAGLVKELAEDFLKTEEVALKEVFADGKELAIEKVIELQTQGKLDDVASKFENMLEVMEEKLIDYMGEKVESETVTEEEKMTYLIIGLGLASAVQHLG